MAEVYHRYKCLILYILVEFTSELIWEFRMGGVWGGGGIINCLKVMSKIVCVFSRVFMSS